MATQVVLAGGRSERMGAPKALLEFDGKTALELVVGAARQAGVARTVVTIGLHGDAIRARHEGSLPPDVIWAQNPVATSPMLSSVQLALRALAAAAESGDGHPSAFFLHPVDVPLALASDYRLLLDAFEREPDEASAGPQVFIPSHASRRGHPILLVGEMAARLLALAPDGTPRDVIEPARKLHIVTPNPGVLEDMDTPEDYRRLLAAYRVNNGA